MPSSKSPQYAYLVKNNCCENANCANFLYCFIPKHLSIENPNMHQCILSCFSIGQQQYGIFQFPAHFSSIWGRTRQPIQLMIRKISQKALFPEEKQHRGDPRAEENQYYLPQPNSKNYKAAREDDRDKPSLKASRKTSHNGPLRTFSIALFKPEAVANDSKELTGSMSGHARLKVQNRKIRSSSHSEAMAVLNSKSALKLQLSRKDHPVRKINLKLETPTKKQKETKEADYDSYYNNAPPSSEFKTVRTQNKADAPGHSSGRASKSSDFSILYQRCFRLIEDYQQQLQQAKRQNGLLLQENRRLRGERMP